MITYKINVTRIDKSALFDGKNGKYLDGAFMENRNGPDQYGNDGFIVQDIGKERREKGEKGPIIGNWKRVETRRSQPAAKPQAAQAEPGPDDDVPF